MEKFTKEFYSTVEAAHILKVSVPTVWGWCKKGKIKAGKTPGGRYRIPRSELERVYKEMYGE